MKISISLFSLQQYSVYATGERTICSQMHLRNRLLPCSSVKYFFGSKENQVLQGNRK
jgi:hypothetical protein